MRKSLCLFLILLLIIPAILPAQENEKITVAVLDLDVSGGVTATYQRPLSDRLRQELINTGRFIVVERNNMESVLTEQGLQMSGCTSDECVVQMGRLLGVQAMIAGSIAKVGNTHTINLRMINVETSKIMIARSTDCACPIDEVLTTSIRDVAFAIAGMGPGEGAGITVTSSGFGDVFIISTPEGATVRLDGKLQLRKKTPCPLENLSAGEHLIELEVGDYSATQTIIVQPDQMTRIEVPLEKGKGTLRVYSDPFDAIVILNGKEIGPTPQTISDLPAGDYSVVLRKDGYVPKETNVSLRANAEERLNVTLRQMAKPEPAELVIKSSVNEGTLIINGTPQQSRFPVTLSDLELGIYEIQVSAPDHEPFRKTVEIQVEKRYTVNAILKKHKGTLVMSALPPGTIVYVDGDEIGTAPLSDYGIDIGSHKIKLRRPGYESRSETITVTRGSDVKITSNMNRKSRGKAIMRSIVPGLGQFYMDRPVPGIIYLVGEAAAVGFMFSAISNYNDLVSEYNDAREAYDAYNTPTPADQAEEITGLYNTKVEAHDDAESAKSTIMVAAGIAGGLYVWNLIDAAIFGETSGGSSYGDSGLQFDLAAMPDSKGDTVPAFKVGVTFGGTGRKDR